MGKYRGYESYKDSGVEWLGEIPEHWEAKRLKQITKLIDGDRGKNYPNETDLRDDGIPFLSTDNIKSNTFDFVKRTRFITSKKFKSLGRGKLIENDLVVTMRGTIGQTALFKNVPYQTAFINAQMIIVRPIKILADFLKYISMSVLWTKQLDFYSYGTAQQQLSGTILGILQLCLPSLEEQKTIARFLDYKTKQIDALIAKKETLLEKLDEKRTALISYAVTKGLDSTVPMKDSGIEWIGDIPEYWDVMAIKRKAQIRGGVAKGRKLDREKAVQLPYLRVANVQDGHIDISDISYIEVLDNEVERFSLRAGDVLMNEGGDNDKLGRGAVWNAEIDPCLHQNHVFAVRPNDRDLSNWFSLLTSSSYAKFYFFSRAKQSTNLASISSTNIRLFPITFPPISEQKEIAEYLDRKTAEIDGQKAKIQQAINLLKEYRTALITNAVTGKIDIRQVKVPLAKGDLGGSN